MRSKTSLLAVSLSPSSGFLSKYANAGRMQNRGLEIDYGFKLFDKKNYGLELYGNFNNNKNEVTDLAGVDRVPLRINLSPQCHRRTTSGHIVR
ncbi:MAG: hypothetical protein IPI77_18035 [Saprospiraceae bacterium]|nr:hypothetical protein [Saprospiraceae bacterium]